MPAGMHLRGDWLPIGVEDRAARFAPAEVGYFGEFRGDFRPHESANPGGH